MTERAAARQFAALVEEINHFLSETKIFVRGDQKLQRMRELMTALGNPQDLTRAVHVAGTSGKTSTAYFAAALLRSQGRTVGLSVSPHITDVRERAQVNGAPLDYADYTVQLREFLALVRQSGILPSYFEFYMGFCFWLAARLQLDYMVVETGMGGLYDGSNVITRRDKICLITDIGLDHVEILGNDLAAIAAQKAGIIQPGNQVFIYEQSEEIMAVVRARCAQVGAELQVLPAEKALDFQVRNAKLARAALGDGEIGLLTVPARAEEFAWRGKTVVLDGAHNPQKLRCFVDYAKPRYQGNALVVSFGANKQQALEENMAILRELGDEIILASFQDHSLETSFRESLPEAAMRAAATKAGFKSIISGGPAAAALALAAATKAKNILVVGSFYLASDARLLML